VTRTTSTLEVKTIQLAFEKVQEPKVGPWMLQAITPNPFTDQTSIAISTEERAEIHLEVYDIAGSLVYQRRLALEEGSHRVQLSSSDLRGSGVYTYRLSSRTQTQLGKLICTN